MKKSLHKTLSVVLDGCIVLPAEYDVVVNDLEIDSRQLQQGGLFIAIDGETVNGVDYIDSAIESGAAAILWDAPADAIPYAWSTAKNKIPLVAIKELKEKLPNIIADFYNKPSELIDIVAVTGTNGKTSCVNYIAQAINVKNKCGLIGTLGLGIYPNVTQGTHTTPDVLTMHKTLAKFVKQDAHYAAIEVSSHALAQGRIDAVSIDTAIFTNLTQDHLDYHGTMEAYFNEKIKLFQSPSLKTAIINLDDSYGLAVVNAAKAKDIITYSAAGNTQADIYAADIQYELDATRFILNAASGKVQIVSNLVADFNISNLLAVSAYLMTKKYSLIEISECIKKIQPVDGRMQKIKVDGFPLVIVDYAHTPDALEQALKSLSLKYSKSLTCVFGCGGERDKDKRKKMGAAADKYAANIILTNDNPRSENSEKIIKQVLLGIKAQEKIQIELDRKKAIIKAIKNTDENGCVLIAGKGHEMYQIIGTSKFNFNDAQVVKEFLSK